MIRNFFLCAASVIICNTTIGLAQNITTMWPYKYSDFQNGTVYFTSQESLSAQFNVHLGKSTLHYLENNIIKEVRAADIAYVIIDNPIDARIPDKYYMYDDQLMHILSGDSTAFIAELILADFASLKESGGAYGSSSNVQSTRKLSSIATSGVGTNHVELKSKKDEGSLLPVNKKYFVVVDDTVYPATNKGIESKLSGSQKEAFKQFVKQQKIKWKDINSLVKLLEFF